MNRQDNDKLRIIVCRPGERAEMIEINNDLDAIQAILGGPPEEYLPFDDPSDPRMEEVALICNEEAKMKKLPKNRAIRNEKGEVLDTISGPFFLCFAPIAGEKYESLPPDLIKKLLKTFAEPESFGP